MKKEYIAPEMVVVEIENETMMLTVSAENGPSYDGGATDMEADANKRRGTWGNLWD